MTHVALPETGEPTRFAFTLDACAALQARFGRGWRDDVFAGLAELQPDVIAAAIEVALVDGDATKAPWGLPLADVSTRLADALCMHLYGRTRAEQDIADEDGLVAAAERIARTEARLSAIRSELSPNV